MMATAVAHAPTTATLPVLRPLLLLLVAVVVTVVGAALSTTGCVAGDNVRSIGEGVAPPSVPLPALSTGAPGDGEDEVTGDGAVRGSKQSTAPYFNA